MLTAEELALGYRACVNNCGEIANPSSDECFTCRHQPFGTEWEQEELDRQGRG